MHRDVIDVAVPRQHVRDEGPQEEDIVRTEWDRLLAKPELALPRKDEQELVVDDHTFGDGEVVTTSAVGDANQGIDPFER